MTPASFRDFLRRRVPVSVPSMRASSLLTRRASGIVGEDLRQCLLVVYFHEMLVLGQRLFIGVELVYPLRSVVIVGLLMHYRLHGQTVALGRVLIGPAERDGRHGEGEPWQFKRVDDELWKIYRSAKEACAQPLFLRDIAEGLAEEQRVGGGVDETKEIVVAWVGLAVFRPKGGAAEVGAESEHHRRACHHGLVEMGRGELRLHLLVARHDNAI